MSLEACAPVPSGSGFLKGTLAYLDCAGQAIGSAGYTALSQSGSIMSQLLLTAVTLFIAWHGIRMMFGRMPAMSDAVLAAAKIGLVLMLATSWPAVQTLFADPAFTGPSELVTQTKIAALPLEDRLQQVDDGIVALTKWGTGKLDISAGTTADGQPAATEFTGIALTDNLALGLGRLCYLMGTIISIGLLKLLSGVMISALPIFAGLLLFESLQSFFWGWLRMMLALFVASFAIPLVLAAELTLIEPWLAGVIADRSATFATPSAPTELLAISGSFLLILVGALALIAKACFAVDFARVAVHLERWRQTGPLAEQPSRQVTRPMAMAEQRVELSRAEALSLTLGRFEQTGRGSPMLLGTGSGSLASAEISEINTGGERPNSARRRARQRVALSQFKRNDS